MNIQWKESTDKVIDRKHSLEAMLNECKKLEQINNEFSNRIYEVEKKVDTFPILPSFGKDTLKRQRIEYKVLFFNEKNLMFFSKKNSFNFSKRK